MIKKDSRNPKQLIKFAIKSKISNLYERALLSIDLMEERALREETEPLKRKLLNESPKSKILKGENTSPEDSEQEHSNQSGNSP